MSSIFKREISAIDFADVMFEHIQQQFAMGYKDNLFPEPEVLA